MCPNLYTNPVCRFQSHERQSVVLTSLKRIMNTLWFRLERKRMSNMIGMWHIMKERVPTSSIIFPIHTRADPILQWILTKVLVVR